jgi:post-segregation antitoxin (ccd killing protein)
MAPRRPALHVSVSEALVAPAKALRIHVSRAAQQGIERSTGVYRKLGFGAASNAARRAYASPGGCLAHGCVTRR